jgi:hypothetical protein
VELLGKATSLTVLEAEQDLPLQPNYLYVISPDTDMAIHSGRLVLTPRAGRRVPHMPVDHLFRSRALDQKARAVGVVLSAGGTDGTLGLKAIKGEGGITFAQDEKSSRHDSMQRSATAERHVDYVLPPREIAQQLVRIAHHPYTAEAEPDGDPADLQDVLDHILAVLRTHTQVDFKRYKRSTITRRVRRFTPMAEKLLNLIPTDVGRPISDIKPNLNIEDLDRRIAQVIDTLTTMETEIQDKQGRWYVLRIRPYVTLEGKIEGASVTLLDIDTLKGRGTETPRDASTESTASAANPSVPERREGASSEGDGEAANG